MDKDLHEVSDRFTIFDSFNLQNIFHKYNLHDSNKSDISDESKSKINVLYCCTPRGVLPSRAPMDISPGFPLGWVTSEWSGQDWIP
jgi:hypothetical protein